MTHAIYCPHKYSRGCKRTHPIQSNQYILTSFPQAIKRNLYFKKELVHTLSLYTHILSHSLTLSHTLSHSLTHSLLFSVFLCLCHSLPFSLCLSVSVDYASNNEQYGSGVEVRWH